MNVSPYRTRVRGAGIVPLIAFMIAALSQSLILASISVPPAFAAANMVLSLFCAYYICFGTAKIFGLYHIFFIFHWIFFGLIPPLELAFDVVYWGGGGKILDQYTTGTLLSAPLMVLFHVIYSAQYRRPNRHATLVPVMKMRASKLAIFSSAASAVIIYWYNGFSITSVMLRGGDIATRPDLDQYAWLVYQYAIYPIPAVALVFYLKVCKRDAISTVTLLLLFAVANPFTGMARFQAASLYIAVFLSIYPAAAIHKVLMSILLVFGMFFIFPLLDAFRRFESELRLSWSIDFIYAGHFDAFQSLARVLEENSPTWGAQLIGALLFFVPRSVWSGKAIGSGAYIANKTGLEFSNISMSYIAEGYINYGIVGSVLFVAVAAWGMSRLDAEMHLSQVQVSATRQVFYPFALGLAFFMMRGDLLSSVAYTVGLLTAVFVLVRISGALNTRGK